MIASESGDLPVIEKLLEAKANVNERRPIGFSALMLASQEGHLSVVKKLLEAKAEVNKQRHDGVTALMSASLFGKETVVKLLLENKADVSTRENQGRNAMFFAKDNVKDILQKRLIQCLNLAAKQGKVDLLKKWIASGADVNSSNALLLASSFKKYSCVAKLLESKANVDKYSKDKCTPLMYAVKSGSNDIVKLLLKKGANPNIKNSNGKQAIDYAESKEIKDMLSQEASSPTDYSPIQMK